MPWDTDIDIGVPVESFDQVSSCDLTCPRYCVGGQLWALKAEFERKGLLLRPGIASLLLVSFEWCGGTGKYPCDVGLYKVTSPVC